MLQANNGVPELAGYFLDRQQTENATKSLERAGCRIQPGRLLRDAWVLAGGNPGACDAVRSGWVALQDEASQAVAKLLAVRPGDSVLDLCAAPGGKTLLLAHAAGDKGRVVAADLHENRVRAMNERLSLSGIGNVETVVLDGSQPLPFARPFDRILVDVPCSGTGTLARHPEIRWKLREEDLRDLHERQAQLLKNALPHLAPNGRLVYSTCSLEPEENELVVREVLREAGDVFTIAKPLDVLDHILQPAVRASSIVDVAWTASSALFRLENGTDGFFAAVVQQQTPGISLTQRTRRAQRKIRKNDFPRGSAFLRPLPNLCVLCVLCVESFLCYSSLGRLPTTHAKLNEGEPMSLRERIESGSFAWACWYSFWPPQGIPQRDHHHAIRGSKAAKWTCTANLVGKSSADAATAILRGRGLQLKVVDRVYSNLPANAVARQSPPEGARMKVGQNAHVVLSLGSQNINTPALLGESLRVARIQLLQSGLCNSEK